MKWMILAAAAVLVGPVSAHAADVCRLTQLTAQSPATTYDPFDVSFSPIAITVNVQSKGCSGARIQFALAPTPTTPQTGPQVDLTSSGQTLLASIQDSGGQAQSVNNQATAFQSNPPFFALTTLGALSNTAPLQFNIQPGQPSPPGGYVGVLTLLARITNGNGQVSTVATTVLDLSVSVSPSVRLAAGAGDLQIDLGELQPNETGGPISFDAYANVDYELRLLSDNGFALVPGGRGGPAGGVPYTIQVSGQTAPDSGESNNGHSIRKLDFGVPGGDGRQRQTLTVKLSPFSDLPAAPDYSDLLTLEIRARV